VQLVSELVGPDDVRVMRRIVVLSIEPTDASFPTNEHLDQPRLRIVLITSRLKSRKSLNPVSMIPRSV
jgi:hypothetical protein